MNGEMTAKLYVAGSLYEHPRAGGIAVVLASDYERLRVEVEALRKAQAKQIELAALIKQLQAEAAETLVVSLPAIDITVRAGECYAGVVLDETGKVKHHVVLMPQRPSKRLEWGDAVEWAESVGGVLPTRQEQSLLFANCKPHIEADWYWSNEAHGSEYAWYCLFDYGTQNFIRQDDEGCAVAVRLIRVVDERAVEGG